ncbi:MAG: peptidylprolyl isomerase, partial [Gammaproteobacteria bacterium]
LLRRNGPVRTVLVRAVMEAVVSEQAGAEPAEGELEAYYREHRSFFASAQRLRVQRIVFDGERAEDAEARAARAFAALGNELTFETARVELGDEDPYPPPDALLPATTLGAYIGPVLLETAMALSEGEHSQPVAYGGAFYVVKVLERDPGVAPALPRIRERVLGEWRRMRQEAALREYIDWLRARAEVRVQRERA